MEPTIPGNDVTMIALVDGDDPEAAADRLEEVVRLAAGRGAVVLAVGHGDRDDAADVVRAAAAAHPGLRAILHTRRVSREEALRVAVERTPNHCLVPPAAPVPRRWFARALAGLVCRMTAPVAPFPRDDP